MIDKEITVYTIGDSKEVKTWSNVPYFFTKALEAKGIKINRVSLEENRIFRFLYKYSIYLWIKVFYPKSTHGYFRSGLNRMLIRKKIKNSIQDFPGSEANVFLTYSFGSKNLSPLPCILFGDWTYLYQIQNLEKRKPYWFEKMALRREKQNIEQADQVLSLFPKSSAFISHNFKRAPALYLGNVVNTEKQADAPELMAKKTKSKQLLFIGGKKYKQAARHLVQAFQELNELEWQDAELHLIGINTEDVSLPNSESVFFHGYLDKNIDSQNNLYYSLLSSARVIINTQNSWGAFSALTEAMFFYTPVICQAFEEFTETYGKSCDFGFYVPDDSVTHLKTALTQMLAQNEEQLQKQMKNAHQKTKDFTWENYANRFLELLSK